MGVTKKGIKEKKPPIEYKGLEAEALKASLATSAKKAIIMIFGNELEDVCLGRIHSVIEMADGLRIAKKDIICKISLEELAKAKRKWEKDQDAEDWFKDNDD